MQSQSGWTGYAVLNSWAHRRTSVNARTRERAKRIVLRQLVNGNVGGTATGTRVRIAAQSPTDPTTSGGKRNVETVTVINRATTATDQTQINNALDFKYGYGASAFPRDKSGNGGGGKRGY